MVNILVVEDKEIDMDKCINLIKGRYTNINLLKATSGKRAYEIISENIVDCVLLDIQLEDIDGYELAFIMRKRGRTHLTPIVFITGTDSESISVYKDYHGHAYIEKPYSQVEFYKVLDPIIEALTTKRIDDNVRKVHIETSGSVVSIPIEEIIYIETIKRIPNIVTYDMVYQVRKKNLMQLIQYIDYPDLIQCHRKCFMNIKKVHSIHRVNYKINDIYFTKSGSIKCPLGFNFRKRVENLLKGESV